MKKTLRILDRSGDTRLEFDSEQEDAAWKAAAIAFDAAKSRGASVFNVTPGTNDTAKRVTSFEELGAEAIVIGKIVGG